MRILEERLDVVEFFVNANEVRHSLHEDFLRRFPNLHLMAKKLHQKKVRLNDLYKLYTIGSWMSTLRMVYASLLRGVSRY